MQTFEAVKARAIKTIGDVSGFFTAAGAEGEIIDHHSPRSAGEVTQRGDSSNVQRRSYKALHEPITSAPQKRSVEEVVGEPSTNKRRRTTERQAERLAHKGDVVPQKLLNVSNGLQHRPWNTPIKAAVNGIRYAMRGPGFKAMNTLSDNRYVKANSTRTAEKDTPRPRATRYGSPPPLSLFATDSSGSRHPTQRSAEDSFDLHNESQPKRRKVNAQRDYAVSTPHNAINLTEGDSQTIEFPPEACFGTVIHRHSAESERKRASFSSHPGQRNFQIEEHSIASRSDKYTQASQEKRRRKPRNSTESSQASTQATPNGEQIHPPVDGMIISDSPPQVHASFIPENDPQALQVDFDQSPPWIPLEIATGRKQHARLSPDGDDKVTNAGSLPSSISSHSGALNHIKSHTEQDETHTKRQQIKQPHSEGVAKPSAALNSIDRAMGKRLDKTFTRDALDKTEAPKLRASQSMKAFSYDPARKDPVRDSLGSMDELATGPTIAEQSTRLRAPHEKRSRPSNDDTIVATTSANELGSKSKQRKADSKESIRYEDSRKAKHSQPAHANEEAGKKIRIPVQRILCRGCCLHQKGIELVWDQDDGFFIDVNGALQRIPGKATLVCIGTLEATWVMHASEEGSLAVQIKGSSNDNSNGNILVEFCTMGGLNAFLIRIEAVATSRFKLKSTQYEVMENIMKLQKDLIRTDYNKYAGRHYDQELELMGKRKNKRDGRPSPQEEQIIYEDEAPKPRLPQRSQMREKPTESSLTTKSPYFDTSRGEQRRSTRQSSATKARSPTPPPPVKWTVENRPEPWSQSIVYPAEGSGRVTVDFQDLERLDEGEFLNDNIINFALRRIEEKMAPEHKQTVHFFNTYFYEALTKGKSGKKGFYYDTVKRWTKSKDLFTLPYVVVPINIDLHWFVAIICNLDNLSRKAIGSSSNVEDDEMLNQASVPAEEQDDDAVDEIVDFDDATKTAETQESLKQMTLDDDEHVAKKSPLGSIIDETEGLVTSRKSTPSSKRSRKKSLPIRKYDPDSPTIITLDSFGSTHSMEIRNLKDYVSAEAQSKRSMSVNTKDLQGMTAKGIPEQSNFCDCGVFLVKYIEEFARDPRRFVTKVLQKQLDQESDFAGFDPSEKRAEIRDELIQMAKEQDLERKERKSAKKPTSTTKTTTPSAVPTSPTPAREQVSTSKTISPAKDDANDESEEMLMDVPRPYRRLSPEVIVNPAAEIVFDARKIRYSEGGKSKANTAARRVAKSTVRTDPAEEEWPGVEVPDSQ